MPRPETTPEQKEEIRREIRRAAKNLYDREGQASLSVRAIAKEAGVSVGTIYTYFGSLQGLTESLWSAPVNKLTKQLQAIADETEDPVERIRALMAAYRQFAQDHERIFRNVFLFVRPLEKPSPVRTPAEDALLPVLLTAALKEGQDQGRIHPGKPEDLAMMLWGSLHGCLALQYNFGRLEFRNPDDIADGVIEAFLTGLIV
ncbi:MAG: TetR/AcrR family transcriptional regulator [Pseudomonadota bacterium]